MQTLRIAIAQINVTVGDLEGNTALIINGIRKAKKNNSDIVLFPELAISGYPAEDLFLRPKFIADTHAALESIVPETKAITALVGYLVQKKTSIFNVLGIMHDGKIACEYKKICLPNYGVFDEKRYFTPGKKTLVIKRNNVQLGILICEDLWIPEGVTETLAFKANAKVIFNVSCSPFQIGKSQERLQMMSDRASHCRVFLVNCNLIGGQDDLVFDGQSLVFDPNGKLLAKGLAFDSDFFVLDLDLDQVQQARKNDDDFQRRRKSFKAPYTYSEKKLPPIIVEEKKEGVKRKKILTISSEEEILRALILGTRDYVLKNGFEKVVLGLSGGIDSALVATIATLALGPEKVVAVMMPTDYTSADSLLHAEIVAKNLGIELINIPIQPTFEAYNATLSDIFSGRGEDVTEENIQARIRGNILMALSNKFNWLVLVCGNKSEVAVGYCTLYGDTAGGFSVIKDIPKTLVYTIAEYLNIREGKELIPQPLFTKPPTAELRNDQKDQDSLPPYEILDPILEAYVEKDASISQIVALGYEEDLVRRVVNMIKISEYKRRQAAPGIKITTRGFNKGWRMPITNGYKERMD